MVLINVRTLDLDPYYHASTITLKLLVRMSHDPYGPLPNLSTVSIHSHDLNGSEKLTALEVLARVLSVQEISGRGLHEDGWLDRVVIHGHTYFKSRSSNVKGLCLDHCNLSSEAFNLIVRMLRALESFHYTPCRKDVVTREELKVFSAFAIRHALAGHCKASLAELVLLTRSWKPYYMGSIRSWNHVTKLTTHWGLLLPSSMPGRRLHSS